jgi:hypothetical protein
MDPASAIGVASAVLTFIDFARELLSTVHSVYTSSTGKTLAHKTLEDVTLEMQRLSGALASHKPTMDQSKDELAMTSLADRCSKLSSEILAHLEQTKAKKGNHGYSFIECVKAASKNIWTKKEVLRLQENLDQCMTLLLQQWTVLEKYLVCPFSYFLYPLSPFVMPLSQCNTC